MTFEMIETKDYSLYNRCSFCDEKASYNFWEKSDKGIKFKFFSCEEHKATAKAKILHGDGKID